jgi:hypothetical protein
MIGMLQSGIECASCLAPEVATKLFKSYPVRCGQDFVRDPFSKISYAVFVCDLLLPIGGSGEERLSHLDVARHSDLRVGSERLAEQRLRLFAITWGGAIN